jgi:hypothetical protein
MTAEEIIQAMSKLSMRITFGLYGCCKDCQS